ncbi:hypothetical protein [Anaerococcus sp. AGMB09787]|uniref:hypothetical protein n=1 Tax=Anaerococcus sp. AGMB09787 TaxID=2922869 RepID=UPI001FAF1704|nr:hypothetical protein [Anaerococcus sp. AGMB09787]
MKLNELKRILKDIKEIKNINQVGNRYIINIEPYKEDQGQLIIELTLVYTDIKDKNSLPYLWYKNGYTKEIINNYISLDTCYTDNLHRSFHYYNPTTKKVANKTVIYFDYILPINNTNVKKIILDTLDMYHKDIKAK